MRTALVIPLALGASAAQAEPWRCAMTVQCASGTACEATALSLDLLPADHAGDLFMTGLGVDLPVRRLSPQTDSPHHYAGRGPNGTALLITIEADTRSVLTLHGGRADSAATSYFGTCEELT